MHGDDEKLHILQQVRAQARCLYTEEQVEAAINAMAAKIAAQLADMNPLFLCVMNGGLFITARLLLRLDFPLQVDYLHATRYRERLSGTDLQWKVYPSISLRDRQVIVLDDILDEGETLARIKQYCESEQAAAVYTAVLVDKQHARKNPQLPIADFTGLYAEDKYLFGYGMDYKGYWRNAPGIYALD